MDVQSVKSSSQKETPKRAQRGGGAGGGGPLPSPTLPRGPVGPGTLRRGWTSKNRGLGGRLFLQQLSATSTPLAGWMPLREKKTQPCPGGNSSLRGEIALAWKSPYSQEGDTFSRLLAPLPEEHRDAPGTWRGTSRPLFSHTLKGEERRDSP